MEKQTYTIWLNGCDDSTRIVMELTDAEVALLQQVAEKSQDASTSGCQPRMELVEGAAKDID